MLRRHAIAVAAGLVLSAQPGCRLFRPQPVEGPNAEPPEAPARPAARAREPPPPEEGEVLVGQMCPEAAAGRPAVRPLFLLGGGAWYDDGELLSRPVTTRAARQFSVLGWDGRRVGLLSVAGAREGGEPAAAVGSYSGGPPCAEPVTVGEDTEVDPACTAALAGCGVAVSALEPAGGFRARPFGEEPPEPAEFPTGGACAVGGRLVVDIDADGETEAFPMAALERGELPEEIVASRAPAAGCEPQFAVGGVADGRGDVLAVLDFDRDGRRELVIAAGQGQSRRWAIYSATSTAARLDRVALAEPWRGRGREPADVGNRATGSGEGR